MSKWILKLDASHDHLPQHLLAAGVCEMEKGAAASLCVTRPSNVSEETRFEKKTVGGGEWGEGFVSEIVT